MYSLLSDGRLSDDSIVSVIQDLFGAGIDSVSFYYLVKWMEIYVHNYWIIYHCSFPLKYGIVTLFKFMWNKNLEKITYLLKKLTYFSSWIGHWNVMDLQSQTLLLLYIHLYSCSISSYWSWWDHGCYLKVPYRFPKFVENLTYSRIHILYPIFIYRYKLKWLMDWK